MPLRTFFLMPLVLGLVFKPAAGTQRNVAVSEITPKLLVFATDSGNVVASIGPDGAFLVGTPSAADTSQISSILTSRTRSAVRYVVIAPQDLAHSEGDAGWGRRGAFVAMQEKALERLGGHVRVLRHRCPVACSSSESTVRASHSQRC